MHSEIILELVKIQTQFRFLHWQTKSYAKHIAYGEFYENLDDLIDTYVEVCMGKHGRPDFQEEFSLLFKDIKTFSLQDLLDDSTNFIVGISDKLDAKKDTDLLNIKDEILAEINKLKYLVTLE
ncbi:MAG: hypothetical protein K9I82_02295 [Chitinophagaceae bacterium]|nr:hypothetical protein [Chitinophagaceae bacterium]